MTATRSYDDVEVGSTLPAQSFPIDRLRLVQYCGASGDFNLIHWDEASATAVGLPNVIAHGMLTMGEAARVVTDWAGDPAAVVDYQVRFSKPVIVPAQGGATVEVTGTVTDKLDDGRVVVSLTASSDGDHVLAAATAVVRLAP